MNPLKQLYNALVSQDCRDAIWKWRRRAPKMWHFQRIKFRYQLSHKPTSNVRILFYPKMPQLIDYGIWKICQLNGYMMTSDTRDPVDLAIAWEDVTWREPNPTLQRIAQEVPCLNLKCVNISKEHVQKMFLKTFGYNLCVDPFTHHGPCVEKSNANFKHDGRVVTCPLTSTKKEYVYQKLINNQCNQNTVEEIRVPILGTQIPFVSLKYRRIDDRFANYFRTIYKETDSILSKEEQATILKFCHEIRLDYGELDVLRDNDDGKIYIVDANNTPSAPPKHMSKEDEWQAICKMAETFHVEFIQTLTTHQ